MKVTLEQILAASKKAGLSVEVDNGIYVPYGCSEEDPITGNIIELLVALGIEVTA
jgi:hypothetical protein